jgi:hypothetical protein
MSKPATQPDHSAPQTGNEQRQAQIEHNRAVIALLDAWEQEDPQEQRTLDEDRPSSRKLFAQ